jgi:predicted ATPase
MARLTKIEIAGYRSIKDMSLELGPLNVLIGANGAGKSNFVTFFWMLNRIWGALLQTYVGTSGGAHSILHFGPKVTQQIYGRLELADVNETGWYEMRLAYAETDSLFFAEEKFGFHLTDHNQPDVTLLGEGHQETRINEVAAQDDAKAKQAKVMRQLLTHYRLYHFNDMSATADIRLFSVVENARWLRPDGSNLASMLYYYREHHEAVYRRIVSTIRHILPEFANFDLEPALYIPSHIKLNWHRQDSDYLFGPHQLSDGTLRAMALSTLLLQPEKDLPDVMILDEPELGLHPHALGIVAGLMRAASLKSQLIVATQSQSLLDYFEPDEIITVESHEGQSTFRRLETEQLRDWLDDYSIGELWQRNVLGGGPLP